MFLKQTMHNNSGLIEFAFHAQQHRKLLPDSYIIDIDAFTDNAAKILKKADEAGISLYFMLKQAGRNPVLANILKSMNFGASVSVDFKEALFYISQGIPLGNVGHLVQIPEAALEKIVDARPEIMTVYSLEKAKSISAIAKAKGIVQPVMLRVFGKDDFMYPGQYAGISIDEIDSFAKELDGLKGIALSGVCGFPCLLYNERKKEIEPTPNAYTVISAADKLRAKGYNITQINLASVNCSESVNIVKRLGGTHMEPGHGLMGSTPAHADGGIESQSMVYMSEISHNFKGNSYCFGGGHYRRSNAKSALVGKDMLGAGEIEILPQDESSIDYHFGLKESANVGDCVVMAFRSQVFVTRSNVVPVKGIKSGKPEIVGIFDPFGRRLE